VSASEKLKALDTAMSDRLLGTANYFFGPNARTAVSRESRDMYEALKAYRIALPQIVAVVEAAEIVAETGALVVDPEWADMDDALEALNEVLP
jgi:hypothetical protein